MSTRTIIRFKGGTQEKYSKLSDDRGEIERVYGVEISAEVTVVAGEFYVDSTSPNPKHEQAVKSLRWAMTKAGLEVLS